MGCARPLRLGGLVSGSGRTVLNIHERIAAGELAARLEIVISSRPEARAVARCRQVGLRAEVVDRRRLDDTAFCQGIADLLREARVELVCMAGFLSFWQIPADFLGRVINIHPALLPAFGGKGLYGDRVHRAVLESGARESGCTVHFADNLYDHGPTILQRKVPVHADDDYEKLAARVFKEELIAYPQAIGMFIDGKCALPDRALQRKN